MIPDLPWTMWAYLLMFALPWAVIFAALAWASGSGGEDEVLPYSDPTADNGHRQMARPLPSAVSS